MESQAVFQAKIQAKFFLLNKVPVLGRGPAAARGGRDLVAEGLDGGGGGGGRPLLMTGAEGGWFRSEIGAILVS